MSESQKLLEQFQISSSKLIDDLETFIDTRSSINENFKFWCQFLTRHTITLDLLRADREGLWHLHIDAMQRALYEFAAWDISFTFLSQSHIRIYHRQVRELNLTSIVHSTTHIPLCMSWMRNYTLKQWGLIQRIMGLHLIKGIFCHQHCGKLWIHVGLWCAIVENALV